MSETTRPRRTQAERTRQRKAQVIREAIRFFGQHGYHGATLAAIAKAAGVTEPGLLHHFPSKAQLLLDVLAERDRIDCERFDSSLHDGGKDPLGTDFFNSAISTCGSRASMYCEMRRRGVTFAAICLPKSW